MQVSDLPVEAKILGSVFEFRWLLYLVFWIVCAAIHRLALRRSSVSSGWSRTVVAAVLFWGLQTGCLYCGWRYRMELRDRYATSPEVARQVAAAGFSWIYCEAYAAGGDVRLSRMPPEIRAEYAKRDYHPRFRDLKAMLAAFIPSVAILVFLQWAVLTLVRGRRRM